MCQAAFLEIQSWTSGTHALQFCNIVFIAFAFYFCSVLIKLFGCFICRTTPGNPLLSQPPKWRRLSLLFWTLTSIKYSVFGIRFQNLFCNLEALEKKKYLESSFIGTPEYTHQDQLFKLVDSTLPSQIV